MNNLKFLRNDRKLTVRGLQAKTGIDYSTYARYESGVRDLSSNLMIKFADFFEVSIDFLIGYKDCYIYAYDVVNDCINKYNYDEYVQLVSSGKIYFENDKRCVKED